MEPPAALEPVREAALEPPREAPEGQKDDAAAAETLPLSVVGGIAVGAFGYSTLSNVLVTMLVYFYLPPESAGLPKLVTDRTFLGILNAIAIIAAAGRFTDSVTDVLVAAWSDRCTSRWGRRIPFMAAGIVPACVATVLMFVPPFAEESWKNIVYLLLMQIILFSSLTCYVAPILALVADVGPTPHERLRITVWSSVTWGMGMVLAAVTFFLAPMLQGSLTPIRAWQVCIAGVCILAGIAMAVPVFIIDEPRWARKAPATVPLLPALRLCLSNRFNRVIVAVDFANVCALAIVQTGLLYYVTVLLQLDQWLSSVLLLALVVASMILSPLVGIVARRWGGGKKLLLLAFVLAILVFLCLTVIGISDRLRYVQGVVPVVLFAVPYTVFVNIIFWISSDIADHASKVRGESLAGMFIAARTFVQKLGSTVGVFLFALLLQLGRDVGDDLGIRLTGLVGAVLYLGAAIVVLFFDEAGLQRELQAGVEQDTALAKV